MVEDLPYLFLKAILAQHHHENANACSVRG